MTLFNLIYILQNKYKYLFFTESALPFCSLCLLKQLSIHLQALCETTLNSCHTGSVNFQQTKNKKKSLITWFNMNIFINLPLVCIAYFFPYQIFKITNTPSQKKITYKLRLYFPSSSKQKPNNKSNYTQ